MRAKGEGCIGKRKDGRHYAYLTITEPSGKTKRQYFYGTEKQVLAELKRAQRRKEDHLPVAQDKQTVEKYVTEWLATTGKATLKDSTFATYSFHVNSYIIPKLGGIKLVELHHRHVQKMLNAQAEGGPTKKGLVKKGLASSTIRYTKAVLQAVLQSAMRDDLVLRNAAALAVVPRSQKVEMHVWDRAQTRLFLSSISGHWMEAFFSVALNLGLRRGEMLALQWKDVDLDKGTLTVRATLNRVSGEIRVSDPKTETSKRTLRMSGSLISILRAHRVRQLKNKVRSGESWKDTNLVFTTFAGGSIEPSNINRSLDELTAKAGLPRIRVHDLRHTAATLMLLNGTPVKVVSEVLGHASIRITLDLYVHVLDEQREDFADRMDNLLYGDSIG